MNTPRQQKPRTAIQHAEACCHHPLLQCKSWHGMAMRSFVLNPKAVHCTIVKRPCGLLFHTPGPLPAGFRSRMGVLAGVPANLPSSTLRLIISTPSRYDADGPGLQALKHLHNSMQ